MPWRVSLHFGAGLGDLARDLGVRRGVAERNLALAFPERTAEERAAILAAHYRELGRVVCEYARLPELARGEDDGVVAAIHGFEHLDAARRAGRGAILLTGHYGNFELLGAWLARFHPVDFVVQPLANPRVEALLGRARREAGVGQIGLGAGARGIFTALHDNHWVALLADQDARRKGVFVPFFGQPSSTPTGPAQLALRTGAPIVMGFDVRRPDGRHELEVQPPLTLAEPESPAAVRTLTALHTARLEEWVRLRPEMWFWLHRRWKSRPPMALANAGAEAAEAPAAAPATGRAGGS
jgi:KDO2-lipid IV(A) lauroyltransferase